MGDSMIVVADGAAGHVIFFTAGTREPLANDGDIDAWLAMDTVSPGFGRIGVSADEMEVQRVGTLRLP